MSIAENIKVRREAKGMTQAQLAERIGSTRSCIAMFERGSRTPDVFLAAEIAKVFNITVDELMK